MAGAAVVLAVIGLLLFMAIRVYAVRAADEAFDRVLAAAALSIADTVEIQEGDVTVDIPYAAFAILGTSRLNRIFYRVAAPNGGLVTGSPTLGLEVPQASTPEPRLHDSVYRGTPIRIAAVARYHAGTSGSGWVDVLVAETREARQQLAGQLTRNAVLPTLAVAFVAFCLIWLAVRRAFLPLGVVEADIRGRAASDLAPIRGPVPHEVRALVAALNEFMDRLGSTLDGLKRVTADAAHQLRTPLANIRAQSEVALDEAPDGSVRERLARIHANAVNASVLASQILSDATILHRLEAQPRAVVDLAATVQEAVRRIDPLQAHRLHLAGCHGGPVPVRGDAFVLREMVRNLVENALVHAPTGPVEVSLTCDAGEARLQVLDRGPGLDADLLERVFERFVRGDETTPGSGLGLPIARTVARACGGDVTLAPRQGGGLCSLVRLPLAGQRPRLPGGGTAIALVLPIVLLATLVPVHAALAQAKLSILGTAPAEQMAPLIAAIEANDPGTTVDYRAVLPTEAALGVIAVAAGASSPDILLLSSPDLAVQLANEGYVISHAAQPAGGGPPVHWRGEVFAVAADPSVIVVRKDSLPGPDVPRSRIALAQLLERAATRLSGRVGLVNIGIDSVSYVAAAQDSLRSPLFWRVTRGFGAAQVRIFDHAGELLQAMAAGELDLAYNVPLSAAQAAIARGAAVEIVVPEDYTVSVPWTVSIPNSAPNPFGARRALDLIVGRDGARALEAGGIGAGPPLTPGRTDSIRQTVALGPELLVFLDPLKRTRFLDTWIQLIVGP